MSKRKLTLWTGRQGTVNFDWAMIEGLTDASGGSYKDLAKKYHTLYYEKQFELERQNSKYSRLSKLFKLLWQVRNK